jgi:hypothetical protein
MPPNSMISPHLQTGQLSENFIIINNTNIQTLIKNVIGLVVLKAVLLTLLHKVFRLLPVNDHDMKERTNKE